MSGLPWFKCFPRDFNEGLIGLSLEERGAYITVLNLIYQHGGPIEDNDGWIAGWCGCATRTWKKIRAALIVRGKLFELNFNGLPALMNERAADEIASRGELSVTKKEAGRKGGQKSRAKANENNNMPQARASNVLEHPTSKRRQTTDNRLSEGSVVPPDGETTAAEPPEDLNAAGWRAAVSLLVRRGGMTEAKARSFFGKLLSAHGLEARDMLGPVAEAVSNGTRDPQAYLTRAAIARAKRRASGPEKRVNFV